VFEQYEVLTFETKAMKKDLPDTVKSTELTSFADDSCIFKSGRKLDVIIRNVQRSLNALA